MSKTTHSYPYLPKNRTFSYVRDDHVFLRQAMYVAQTQSLDPLFPTGAVVVKDGKVIGTGANGSVYHEKHGCERKRRNIPTGQRYDLCEGCDPKNHAEQKAIAEAKKNGYDCDGADLYLYGHWWACEGCWDAMIENGIKKVFLGESTRRFLKK